MCFYLVASFRYGFGVSMPDAIKYKILFKLKKKSKAQLQVH